MANKFNERIVPGAPQDPYIAKAEHIEYLDGANPKSVQAKINELEQGTTKFKSIVFKRSNSTVTKPAADQGSYENPVPAGWSDGIPTESNEQIWMSTRIFSKDGNHGDWTTAVPISDTADIDFAFNSDAEYTGLPTAVSVKTKPVQYDNNWSDSANVNTVWMAVRRISNGEYAGSWEISKIKGEDGQDGTDGSNGYSSRTFNIYINTESKDNPPSVPSSSANVYWDLTNNALVNLPQPWSDNNTTIPNTYTWMSFGYFSSENGGAQIGVWSTPIRITGADGENGKDGNSSEYIYALTDGEAPNYPSDQVGVFTNRSDLFNRVESNGSAEYSGTIWYDRAQSISEATGRKVEWVAVRMKVGGSDEWNSYSESPTIWAHWGSDGTDGDGVEYIFRAVPNNSTYVTEQSGVYSLNQAYWPATDPNGWTDDPTDVNPSLPLEFVCIRKYDGDTETWGAYSTPVLWNKYVTNGVNAVSYRTFNLYHNASDDTTAPSLPTGTFTWNTTTGVLVQGQGASLNGWDDDQAHDSQNPYVWMTYGEFSSADNGAQIKAWSTPMLISGPEGEPGTDGAEYEYIYALTDTTASPIAYEGTINLFNSVEQNKSYAFEKDGVTTTWYDNAQSIADETNKRVEWIAQMKKTASGNEFSATPIIWAHWGSDGTDGDGTEYIYRIVGDNAVTIDSNDGTITLNSEHWPSRDIDGHLAGTTTNNVPYSEDLDDWIPADWTDEPSDVSSTQKYEFVCIRKKNGNSGNETWNWFGEPKLWNRFTADGRGYTVLCSHDTIALNDDLSLKTPTALFTVDLLDNGNAVSGAVVSIKSPSGTVITTGTTTFSSQLSTLLTSQYLSSNEGFVVEVTIPGTSTVITKNISFVKDGAGATLYSIDLSPEVAILGYDKNDTTNCRNLKTFTQAISVVGSPSAVSNINASVTSGHSGITTSVSGTQVNVTIPVGTSLANPIVITVTGKVDGNDCSAKYVVSGIPIETTLEPYKVVDISNDRIPFFVSDDGEIYRNQSDSASARLRVGGESLVLSSIKINGTEIANTETWDSYYWYGENEGGYALKIDTGSKILQNQTSALLYIEGPTDTDDMSFVQPGEHVEFEVTLTGSYNGVSIERTASLFVFGNRSEIIYDLLASNGVLKLNEDGHLTQNPNVAIMKKIKGAYGNSFETSLPVEEIESLAFAYEISGSAPVYVRNPDIASSSSITIPMPDRSFENDDYILISVWENSQSIGTAGTYLDAEQFVVVKDGEPGSDGLSMVSVVNPKSIPITYNASGAKTWGVNSNFNVEFDVLLNGESWTTSLATILPNYSGYVAAGFNGYKGSGSDERLITLPIEADPDNLIPTSVNFLDAVSEYNNRYEGHEITPANFTSIEFYFTLAPDPGVSGTMYSLKESILPVVNGKSGSDSIPYTFVGEWVARKQYYHTTTRVDLVKHNGKYYICKNSNKNSGWVAGNWQEFEGNYENIATGFLFAENAVVQNLKVAEVATKESSNNGVITINEGGAAGKGNNAILGYASNEVIPGIMISGKPLGESVFDIISTASVNDIKYHSDNSIDLNNDTYLDTYVSAMNSETPYIPSDYVSPQPIKGNYFVIGSSNNISADQSVPTSVRLASGASCNVNFYYNYNNNVVEINQHNFQYSPIIWLPTMGVYICSLENSKYNIVGKIGYLMPGESSYSIKSSGSVAIEPNKTYYIVLAPEGGRLSNPSIDPVDDNVITIDGNQVTFSAQNVSSKITVSDLTVECFTGDGREGVTIAPNGIMVYFGAGEFLRFVKTEGVVHAEWIHNSSSVINDTELGG